LTNSHIVSGANHIVVILRAGRDSPNGQLDGEGPYTEVSHYMRKNRDLSFAAHWVTFLCAAALGFSGCAAAPLLSGVMSSSGETAASTAPVAIPPPSFFDSVTRSTKIALLSPPALLDGGTRVGAYVIEQQCRFHTPDPPFVAPHPVSAQGWTMVGRYNQSNDMQAVQYQGLWGFGYEKQQLNNWPVVFLTLSQMPSFYMSQRVQMLAKAKISKKDQDRLMAESFTRADRIREAVKRLEASYNPELQCLSRK
jgi:hypothetical protein